MRTIAIAKKSKNCYVTNGHWPNVCGTSLYYVADEHHVFG